MGALDVVDREVLCGVAVAYRLPASFTFTAAQAPRNAFVGCISRSTAQPSSPLLAHLLTHSRPHRSIPGGSYSQAPGKICLPLRTFSPFRLHSLADSRRFRSILTGLALSGLGCNVVYTCSPATGAFAVRRSVRVSAVVGESVAQMTDRVRKAYGKAAGSERWRHLLVRRSNLRNSHLPTQSRVHTPNLNRPCMLWSRLPSHLRMELTD
jgi:hypothetical protein